MPNLDKLEEGESSKQNISPSKDHLVFTYVSFSQGSKSSNQHEVLLRDLNLCLTSTHGHSQNSKYPKGRWYQEKIKENLFGDRIKGINCYPL